MSQRVINLYTYLIQNRKHELFGWHEDYENFSKDVEIIRNNLETSELRDVATYKDTSFAKTNKPFDSFIQRLLYELANGIASVVNLF